VHAVDHRVYVRIAGVDMRHDQGLVLAQAKVPQRPHHYAEHQLTPGRVAGREADREVEDGLLRTRKARCACHDPDSDVEASCRQVLEGDPVDALIRVDAVLPS
jgi:hypothetical protein